MKKTIASIFIIISILVAGVITVNAQATPAPASSPASIGGETYKLLAPLPCLDGMTGCTKGKDMPEIDLNGYIGYIFKFSIAIAALLAVIMIIYGGFEWMLSESVTNKSDAKKKIQDAITGLLMVLASYLILQTIDPRLVQINSDIEQIKVPEPATTQTTQTKLTTELKNIDTQTQANITNLQKTLDTNQGQITELTNKNIMGGGLTDDELNKLNALYMENETIKAQLTKNIADSTVSNNANAIMNATDVISRANSALEIETNYNKAIELLDPQIDAEEIQDLQDQRKALLEANGAQQYLVSDIAKYNYWKSSPNSDQYADARANLQRTLVNDQEELKKIPTTYVDPVFQQQYAAIVQDRIDKANAALGRTPPKK